MWDVDCTFCAAATCPGAAVRAVSCSSVSSQQVKLTRRTQLEITGLQEQQEPNEGVPCLDEKRRSQPQQLTRPTHALLCKPGRVQ
jgi:hypothetical protein